MMEVNYNYKSRNEANIHIEAFMFGQEKYPDWFRNEISAGRVFVEMTNPKNKQIRRLPKSAKLNVKSESTYTAYPYEMIINNLIPGKLCVLPYEVFNRMFENEEVINGSTTRNK